MSSPAIYSPLPLTLQKPWRLALPALLLLLAWILFLYRDTATAMVLIWYRSDTFTHGFLVPPIVLWLVWRQRGLLAAQTPQPALDAFLGIACAAFIWLMGDLVAINAVTQLAFVALLVLTVPAVLGWSVTRLLIFPLGFLFFAVPIGEFLLPQFMEWTASFTIFALRLSGIPVYREGLNFVIPSGHWSVVEACSGVRYLIASLMVGTLFAYLNYRSSQRRILFVLVSIVVPVIANWMRAYMIVMLGHLSGNRLAAGVDHIIYGWLFFGVVMMLMFIIGARWAEPQKMANERGAELFPPIRPVTDAKLWATTACFAALVALPHIALVGLDRGEEVADAVTLDAPTALSASWQAVRLAEPGLKPAFRNPSAEINRSYNSQGRVVGLYLGYYQNQNYSRKLVSSNNVLVVTQDPQWSQIVSGSRRVSLGDQVLVVRTTELRGLPMAKHAHEDRLTAWQFYWINGTVTASDYLAKAYGAFYRLLGRGDDSAVIIVYTPKNQAGGAETVLASFLSSNYASINELLLKTKKN